MSDAENGQGTRCDLVLLVAHGLEATPLIKQFDLTPLQRSPFKTYGNPAGLRLIVSGMGKVRAAAATGYMAALTEASAYLNIGIAGHGAARVGQGFLITKLLEVSTGQTCFPTPLGLSLPGSELHTVDRPQLEYPSPVAYDMEATAFFSAASSLGELDLTHCYKLISDTPEQDVGQINKAMLAGLFSDGSADIESLVSHLLARAGDRRRLHELPPAYYSLKRDLRLSVTQGHQLKALSRRCLALGLESELTRLAEMKKQNPAGVLRQLSAAIAARS